MTSPVETIVIAILAILALVGFICVMAVIAAMLYIKSGGEIHLDYTPDDDETKTD